MPAASHMPSTCRLHAVAATARLEKEGELVGFLGSGEGVGRNKHQMPMLASFPLSLSFLFGSGWAVCAVARWVNTISTIAWHAIPHPREAKAVSPVLWLIGHPWPKEAAIQAAAPLPLAYCRSTAIGDAEGDCDDWGSRTWRAVQSPDGRRTLCEGGSYPRSFWPRRSRIRTCEEKVEAVPAEYKGGPCLSDSAEDSP